ncbi:hypothetical protein BDZ91DRAFT_767779 [Kalaharituber pfeilii]|nr:hypothetical protein BDZ91DRAFT_767779 [Kalaharituber pfeilii]
MLEYKLIAGRAQLAGAGMERLCGCWVDARMTSGGERVPVVVGESSLPVYVIFWFDAITNEAFKLKIFGCIEIEGNQGVELGGRSRGLRSFNYVNSQLNCVNRTFKRHKSIWVPMRGPAGIIDRCRRSPVMEALSLNGFFPVLAASPVGRWFLDLEYKYEKRVHGRMYRVRTYKPQNVLCGRCHEVAQQKLLGIILGSFNYTDSTLKMQGASLVTRQEA